MNDILLYIVSVMSYCIKRMAKFEIWEVSKSRKYKLDIHKKRRGTKGIRDTIL